MPEAWGAVSASAYDLRVWDDEAVVFVDATADTHHLSSAATAVLLALRSEAGSRLSAQAWYELLVADDPESTEAVEGDARMPLSDFESLLLGLERVGVAARFPA